MSETEVGNGKRRRRRRETTSSEAAVEMATRREGGGVVTNVKSSRMGRKVSLVKEYGLGAR